MKVRKKHNEIIVKRKKKKGECVEFHGRSKTYTLSAGCDQMTEKTKTTSDMIIP